MALSTDSTVIRSKEFITSTVENEIVMMSLAKGTYYGLDRIGSGIWEMIAQPTKVSTLCQQLTDQFDVAPEQCEGDVLDFLSTLQKEGMIQVIEEKSG